MVRRYIERELSIAVSLRAVERTVAPYRQRLVAEATLRFETPRGRQLQIDFGTSWVPIVRVVPITAFRVTPVEVECQDGLVRDPARLLIA